MRILTVLICKLLAFIGKCLNKGTSFPGAVALKIRPEILSELVLPENIIAVTGSNGKTSTVEMIAKIISDSNKTVVWNKEGSNQIEGIATLLIKNSTLSGRVKGDAVVIESDERYARYTFKYIKPTHFVITNLYRDQLTRNAHPFWIYNIINDAISLIPEATLILNGDDPIIRRFGLGRPNVYYFGMAENKYSRKETDAVYNDCYYCPVCKKKLTYSFFHYSHLGDYCCDNCGYKRPKIDFLVDGMDLDNNKIVINGKEIGLEFASRYNVYNLCSAFAVCSVIGVDEKLISRSLNDFIMKNGRVVRFRAGDNEGILITSKHENSTSYNQSLEYVASVKENSELLIMVDAVSRKYYTAETSWLWDISFEKLEESNVKKIFLCGKYAYDLAVRFEVINLPEIEISVEPDLDKMAEMIKFPTDLRLFAITCFSDKDKLYSRVEVQTPTAK